MASQSAEILGFIAEWYDPQPMMTRQYLTKVFVEDNDVEVISYFHYVKVQSGPSRRRRQTARGPARKVWAVGYRSGALRMTR